MAEINPITRVFTYQGLKLLDPDKSMSVDAVRKHYATRFAALLNAAIEGPKVSVGKVTYEFVHAIGTKG